MHSRFAPSRASAGAWIGGGRKVKQPNRMNVPERSWKVSEETANEVFDSLSVVLLALPGMAHSTQARAFPFL